MNDQPKIQEITVCAFLHDGRKLFIARRSINKEFMPGKFELVGGHVEYGESLEVALKREFQEELGLEIVVGDVFNAFTYFNGVKHAVEIDYFARLADPQAVIRLNPEDHSECRWVDRAELDAVWDKHDPEYAAIQKGFDLLDPRQAKI